MHSQSSDEAGAGQLLGTQHVASIAPCLTASFGSKLGLDNQHIDGGAGHFVVATFDETQVTSPTNRSSCSPSPSPSLTSTGRPPAIAFNARQDPVNGAVAGALDTDGTTQAVCITGERTHALCAVGADASEDGTGRGTPIVTCQTSVRRLTPLEAERLQGFPDRWTALEKAKDSPRYHAIGNSMAVPVMQWIGRRIQMVDALLHPPP